MIDLGSSPTPPLTKEIMNASISSMFKMPTIKAFSNALLLQPVNDAIKCKAFPNTMV